MANQHLWGMAGGGPAGTRQASTKRKQSSWLRSIVAGAAMLAVSSLGAVVLFDWYFFSVVDGLSITLRPIVGAFYQASGETETGPPSRSSDRQQPGEHFPVPSEQSDRASVEPVLAPLRSVAGPRNPAN